MDYSKLCEDILKLDPKIRFAGVFPLENEHFLLVTAEVESDHNNIINSVLKLLKS